MSEKMYNACIKALHRNGLLNMTYKEAMDDFKESLEAGNTIGMITSAELQKLLDYIKKYSMR